MSLETYDPNVRWAAKALTALSELERLVGEPVAWPTMPPSKGQSPVLFEDGYAEGWAKCLSACKALFAAPPAQQPPEIEVQCPVCNHKFYEWPNDQQPQARPDFTDEWTGYLKDGETPFERFLRERKDLGALTNLYQRALEENERLKAQQPQAEALSELTGCNCRWRGDEVVSRCELHEAWHVAIHEWAERAKAAEAKQAEATHQYDLAHRLRVHLANRHTLTGPEFKNGVETILAEYYAPPQQAEAVPMTEDEIEAAARGASCHADLVRAVERHHGIVGKEDGNV